MKHATETPEGLLKAKKMLSHLIEHEHWLYRKYFTLLGQEAGFIRSEQFAALRTIKLQQDELQLRIETLSGKIARLAAMLPEALTFKALAAREEMRRQIAAKIQTRLQQNLRHCESKKSTFAAGLKEIGNFRRTRRKILPNFFSNKTSEIVDMRR